MLKAVIIRPDESVEEITLTGDVLRSMQSAVGGYIEPVRTLIPHAQAWVNDDWHGHAFNRRASILAETSIVGNMLITGPADEHGNETPVPMGMVEFVTRHTANPDHGEGDTDTEEDDSFRRKIEAQDADEAR